MGSRVVYGGYLGSATLPMWGRGFQKWGPGGPVGSLGAWDPPQGGQRARKWGLGGHLGSVGVWDPHYVG